MAKEKPLPQKVDPKQKKKTPKFKKIYVCNFMEPSRGPANGIQEKSMPLRLKFSEENLIDSRALREGELITMDIP